MSANWGTNLELSIFGESHGPAIGINIGNLPAGVRLDMAAIRSEMKRRAPGRNRMSTSRVEADEFEILSGVLDDVTTGAPLMALIRNTSSRSKDYSELKRKMRPGHADYPAYIKYHGDNDIRGGGHFSGRLTAPIVFAGAIAKQILETKGIRVYSHVLKIKDVHDEHFSLETPVSVLEELARKEYPVLSDDIYEEMKETILTARKNGDSVGGKVECMITGVKPGVGRPFFDSLEAHLAPLIFSIPGVKALSFGDLDDITDHYGHEVNDSYYYDHEGNIKTRTDHNGGILGGLTTGMPILFTVSFKPTPSIALPQATVDVVDQENTILEIHGRHDPCICLRGAVVTEAMAALGILDEVNV